MNPSKPRIDPHVREQLLQGFNYGPTISFDQACKLLKMDKKTLRQRMNEGMLTCRIVGGGALRKRREFTISDLEDFYVAAATKGLRAVRPSRIIRPGRPVRGSFMAEFETGKTGI